VPQHQSELERVSAVFQALADPTRLAVVERLSVGPASTSELARPFEMALPSFIQHLAVLERVGIVSSQKSGRVRIYQLLPDALARAATWLGTNRSHWERRLDQLDELLLGGPPNSASTTQHKAITTPAITPAITPARSSTTTTQEQAP